MRTIFRLKKKKWRFPRLGDLAGMARLAAVLAVSHGGLRAEWPPVNWVFTAGGIGPESLTSVAPLPDGSLLASGFFGHNAGLVETSHFAGTELVSNGRRDILFAKVKPDGGLAWVKTFGGAGADTGAAVAPDLSGGFFCAGLYGQGGSFAVPSDFLVGSTRMTGTEEAFVARLNGEGEVLWSRAFSGAATWVQAIATDRDGNLAVAGHYEDRDLRIGDTLLVDAGARDGFLAKFSRDGDLLWARRIAGTDYQDTQDLAVTQQGLLVVTGRLRHRTFFENQLVSDPGSAYVAAYNPEGNVQWVAIPTRTAPAVVGSLHVNETFGEYVARGPDGSIYAAGIFRGTARFGETDIHSNGEKLDVWLAKYNPEGAVQWVQTAGSEGDNRPRALHVLENGDCLLAGYLPPGEFMAFGDDWLFDDTYEGSDAFLARYNPEGRLMALRRIPGTGSVVINGIASTRAGDIYLAGGFRGSFEMDGRLVSAAGDMDVFLLKLGWDSHRLRIERSGDGALAISWPAGSDEVKLMEASVLEGTWSPVTDTPVANGSERAVTVPPSGEARFFRLEVR